MNEFWIEHRIDEKEFRLYPHSEHKYQAVFVLRGKVNYQVNQTAYELTKGGMIVLNTLENHTLEVMEYPYERFIFQIDPAFFQSEIRHPEIIAIFIRRPKEFSHLIELPDSTWRYVYQCLLEMEKEYKQKAEYWQIMVGSQLRRMFVTIYRKCRDTLAVGKVDANTETVFEIQNYLDQNYNQNMKIEDIASRFYLNRHYIAHVFKEVTGMSIMQYVITLRINKAKTLLIEGKVSISAIAIECGYSNFTYFSKLFKKNTGYTPKDYRELYRKGIKIE